MKQSSYFKLVALALVGIYLYTTAKKNGGTLQGNPDGVKVRVDPDLAVDLLSEPFGIHPQVKHYLKVGARSVVKRVAKPYGVEQTRF